MNHRHQLAALASGAIVVLGAVSVDAADPYRDVYPGGLTVASDTVRMLDTRAGAPPRVELTPRPQWASAALVNVTIVDPAAAGYAAVYDCGDVPDVSHVTWTAAGAVESNMVAAPLSPAGELCIHTSTPADVVIDLVGWAQTEIVWVVP